MTRCVIATKPTVITLNRAIARAEVDGETEPVRGRRRAEK
jgi:hypothetical protein